MAPAFNAHLRFLSHFRVQLLFVGAVLFLLPIPVALPGQEFRCLYVVLLMGFLWTTETLPLQITALIPLFAYPLLGIVPAVVVAEEYFNKIILIFFAVLLMAIAVEASGLHERIALRILLYTGTSPSLLMLGIQVSAAFLSMWINNSAVTAMMLPIVLSMINRLEHFKRQQENKLNAKLKEIYGMEKIANKHSTYMPPINGRNDIVPLPPSHPIPLTNPCSTTDANFGRRHSHVDTVDLEAIDARHAGFYRALLLSVCYASSIGGIATLIGTAPNLVFARVVKSGNQKTDPVSFLHWTMFALPAAILMLAFCWCWLGWLFVGFRRKEDSQVQKSIHAMLQQRYDALGPVKFAETIVFACFSLQLLFWITRPALWGQWFGTKVPTQNPWEIDYHDEHSELAAATMACAIPKRDELVHDSTVAIVLAFALFILPCDNPFRAKAVEVPPILTWKLVHKKFDWQTLLLMGGSFALAKGVECSGLSVLIGRSLSQPILRDNPMLFIAFACMLATILTEFSSNTSTCTILLATLKGLAESDPSIDFIRYVLPVTISCSFAFMLPAGTPPNSIVFGSGLLRVLHMVKAGLMLNVFGLVVVITLGNVYAPLIFGTMNIAANINSTTRIK